MANSFTSSARRWRTGALIGIGFFMRGSTLARAIPATKLCTAAIGAGGVRSWCRNKEPNRAALPIPDTAHYPVQKPGLRQRVPGLGALLGLFAGRFDVTQM